MVVELERSVGLPVVVESLQLDTQVGRQRFDTHPLDGIPLSNTDPHVHKTHCSKKCAYRLKLTNYSANCNINYISSYNSISFAPQAFLLQAFSIPQLTNILQHFCLYAGSDISSARRPSSLHEGFITSIQQSMAGKSQEVGRILDGLIRSIHSAGLNNTIAP